MTREIVILASATGTALNAVYVWPQVTRAARTTAGLATGTVLLGCTARLAWTCYAVIQHDPGLLAGQTPPALAFLTLAVLVIVRQPARRTRVVTALALGSAATLAAAWYPPLLATIAIATAAVTAVPQLFGPFTPGAAAGVSGHTYALAATASAIWLSYGLLTANPTVYLTHALILPTSVLVAIRIRLARRRGPPLSPALSLS
ncbi:hypothetical protein AB0J86_05450 [Micromonospora sp. NPDC049559]|uniref:hypothetical protein n=1 Tax=Micromonospora sp. NPDC049559 TaxID=3155923 RepID=UPI0034251292